MQSFADDEPGRDATASAEGDVVLDDDGCSLDGFEDAADQRVRADFDVRTDLSTRADGVTGVHERPVADVRRRC